MQVADRPDLAEFQCNGALAAAKRLKANPRALAEKIAGHLRQSPLFSEVTVAVQPGFVNVKLRTDAALDGSGCKPWRRIRRRAFQIWARAGAR